MSKYAHLSDAEMFSMYKQRLPGFRKNLAKLTSLLKGFFGKAFSAFATDILIEDVGGRSAHDLKDNNSLTVTGFKAPSASKLRNYIEIATYADDIDYLKNFVERAKKTKTEMNERYEEAKRMRDAMVVTFNTALDAMTELAEQKIPDNIGNLFKLAEKAAAQIGSEAQDVMIQLDVRKDEGVHFVLTLDISNWERESKTDILAIVVTAVMTETQNGEYSTRAYVNIHDKSVLPFRYNLGTEVVGPNIKAIGSKFQDVMEHQLAAHHVVAVIAPAPLPIDDVTVTTMLMDIKGVAGVNVFEDSIEVEIPGDNKDTIANVVRALNVFPKIRAMFDKGYTPRFASVGAGHWKYSVSRKNGSGGIGGDAAQADLADHGASHHTLAARIPLGKAIGIGNVTSLLQKIRGVGKVKVTSNAIEIEIPGDKPIVAQDPLTDEQKAAEKANPKPKVPYNETKTVTSHIMTALNSYAPIQKLINEDQVPRFEQEVPGLWKYSVSRKA